MSALMVLGSKQNKVKNFVQFNNCQKNMGLHYFFPLLRSVRQRTKQLNAKMKPIASRTPTLSRASSGLPAFTLSSHWSLITVVLFSQCGCYGFDLSTLNWRLLESKNYLERISFLVRTIWWIQCPRGR